jgi:hypothetical protein
MSKVAPMPQRENHYDFRSWSHIGEPEMSPDVVVRLNVKTKYSCEVVFKGGTPGGLAEPVRVTDAGPRIY